MVRLDCRCPATEKLFGRLRPSRQNFFKSAFGIASPPELLFFEPVEECPSLHNKCVTLTQRVNILYRFVSVRAFSEIFCIGSQNSYLVLFSTRKYRFGPISKSIGIGDTNKLYRFTLCLQQYAVVAAKATGTVDTISGKHTPVEAASQGS